MIAYFISKTNLEIKDVVQVSTYKLSEDSNYTGRSYLVVPRKVNSTENDFILLKESGKVEFLGIVTNTSNTDENASVTINIGEIANLFDRNIILENESVIAETGVEDFIANAISINFSNSDDTLLNMEYIASVARTHTKLSTVPESENGIFNLLSYIIQLREKNGIFIEFEISNTALTVGIELRQQETLKIDATAKEVSNYEETVSSDILAKLTVIWNNKTETTTKNYYLLTDKTVTQDKDDINRVAGNVDTIYMETEEEEEVDQEANDRFKSNSYEHSVTADILTNSNLYPQEQFYIGHMCKIKTRKSGVLDSLITNITRSNSTKQMSVKFGNLAVTLIEKLKGGIK